MSEGLKIFYKRFAYFYESKYGLVARQKIIDLGIKSIVICENCIEIHLEHPGRLIGAYGQNIENLSNFFEKHIKIVEVENPTNNILNCLNDICIECGELIKEKFKSPLFPDEIFCSKECVDNYVYENW